MVIHSNGLLYIFLCEYQLSQNTLLHVKLPTGHLDYESEVKLFDNVRAMRITGLHIKVMGEWSWFASLGFNLII